tara:strand:- start:5437 stop:5712 length:276 start_codon:yes stop_codon:yes gene_type:complete
MKEILSLFHHTHHRKGNHEVHHCGGEHVKRNPKLDYTIKHCLCGKHSINKKYAIGHATNEKLKTMEVKVKFTEKCPGKGWHVESGVQVSKS